MGLRQIREARGLSIEHCAVLADVDKSTISRYERGLSELRSGSIVKLARALKVSPTKITEGNGT